MVLTPKTFGILAIVVAGVGYACKEWTDAVESKRSGIGKALDAYSESSRHQEIRMALQAQQTQLTTFQNKVLPNIDYKAAVLQGIVQLSQMQTLVRQESEDLSQLIDKLMFSSLFKQKFKDFEAQQPAPIKYEQPSKEALQKEMTWQDAVQVGIAAVSVLTTALPIMIYGDGIITAAKTQMKFLKSVVRCGRWAVRILYVVGACLAGYGAMKGIK
jgi:hypothetical protein